MAKTQIVGGQIKDGTIYREDLNTSISGRALIQKVIPGNGISIQSTGIDEGTGDVTLSIDNTSSITWNVIVISNNYNANINDHIFLDGTTTINITLPLSTEIIPGDRIKITDISGNMTTNATVINRNGSNIMKLPENFNMNANYITCIFTYLNTEIGWGIEF